MAIMIKNLKEATPKQKEKDSKHRATFKLSMTQGNSIIEIRNMKLVELTPNKLSIQFPGFYITDLKEKTKNYYSSIDLDIDTEAKIEKQVVSMWTTHEKIVINNFEEITKQLAIDDPFGDQ